MKYSVSPRSPFDIVVDVFRLALHPILSESRRVRRVERVYHLNTAARKSEVSAYAFASEIASFNQGAIIEYVFMLAEKHKKLRQGLENNSLDLQKDVDDLISFMNKGFFRSIYGNFKYLHRHFSGRSKTSPRISVLGNWRTEEKDKVITIFRDRPVDYYNIFSLEESSALVHSARTGTPFLCNDLVYATLNEGYKNPRLDITKLEKKSAHLTKSISYYKLNKEWKSFWKVGNQDHCSFYKSTLVMPISIDRSRLNSDMISRFRAQDADRLIFGYLCLDHSDRDYFDEDLDLPVSKMVADIISIFSFQRLRFTDFSTTFNAAEGALDEHENNHWLRESLREIIESVSDQNQDSRDTKEHEEPSKTVLMTADEVLLQAVKSKAVEIEAAL